MSLWKAPRSRGGAEGEDADAEYEEYEDEAESDEEFDDDEEYEYEYEDDGEEDGEDEYEYEEDELEAEDEEWEEEDDESFEWSDAWDEDGDGEVSAKEFGRSVSFGVLCMLPLLLGYECALASPTEGAEVTRSTAEAILSKPLGPFGDSIEALVRRSILVTLALYALVGSYRRGVPVVPRVVRVLTEGLVAATLLGPLMALTARAAEPFVGAMMIGESAGVPNLRRAAFVMGGAAYEELLFRVLAVALVFLILRRGCVWVGLGNRLAYFSGAVGATLASALAFAFFHTDVAAAWLGGGGEPYDAALFTWRAASGVLLTLIVFWRGVGVAAWAHALFNLALLIGVRPPQLF